MICWIAALAALTAQGPADPSADPRLATPVTYSTAGETLSKTMAGLGKPAGVKLEVAKGYDQDFLVLRASGVPLGETMRKVADHFELEWRVYGEGYLLIQTSEAKKAEEEALKEQFLRPYVEMQKKLKEKLAGPKPDLEAAKEDLERMREGTRPDIATDMRAYQSWGERFGELTNIANPGYWVAMALVSDLDPDLFIELDDWGTIVFSTAPTRTQRRMPNVDPDLLQGFIEAALKGYAELQRRRADYPDPRPAAVHVRLRMVSAGGNFHAHTHLLDENGEVISLTLSRDFSFQVTRPRGNADLNDRTPKGTNLDKEVALEGPFSYMIDGSAQRDPDKMAEAMTFIFSRMAQLDKHEPLRWSFGGLMLQIADKADVNFISDLHDEMFTAPGGMVGKTARDRLATFGNAANCKLNEDGGWVALSHMERALARAKQVPRKLIRQIKEWGRAHGTLTLDEAGWVALQLTNLQLGNQILSFAADMHVIGPRSNNVFNDKPHVQVLRLWALLSSRNKAALLNDGSLQVGSMPPAARQQLWRCLLTPGGITFSRPYPGRRDMSPTQVFPNGLPPNAVITAELDEEWVLLVKQRVEGLDLFMPVTMPLERLARMGRDPEQAFDMSAVRFGKSLEITVRVPETGWTADLNDPVFDMSKPAVPWSQMPDEVKERFEELRKGSGGPPPPPEAAP
ncbi:MAG: hypothetical protein IH851_00405 [Armatimonadetes bacterium]|nr:hypothetical protein [Armatimonadota bacterium]